ncbi:MAG TPA: hypothetical protein VHL34_14360 [Rhizomicrobium sp.]|jgi:hypothetical protein|nr:hypothetical protein [Rhizomicrobium sp.]
MDSFEIPFLILLLVALVFGGVQIQKAVRTGVVTHWFMFQPVRRNRRDTPVDFWFGVAYYIVTWIFALVLIGMLLSGAF